jgi:hypothetical protein
MYGLIRILLFYGIFNPIQGLFIPCSDKKDCIEELTELEVPVRNELLKTFKPIHVHRVLIGQNLEF